VPNVTPQLGKRKRGSTTATAPENGDEVDELSPEHDGLTIRSIEKSRRVAAAISPAPVELDDLADELSVMGDIFSSAQKLGHDVSVVAQGTPIAVAMRARHTARNGAPTPTRLPTSPAPGLEVARIPRKPKSVELAPATPALPLEDRTRLSSVSVVPSGPTFATPAIRQRADESEDELSPPKSDITSARANATTRTLVIQNEEDIDELSPQTKVAQLMVQDKLPEMAQSNGEAPIDKSVPSKARRGRPRRPVVEDEEDEQGVVQPTPLAHVKLLTQPQVNGDAPTGKSVPPKVRRGRPQRPVAEDEDNDAQPIPAASKLRQPRTQGPETEEDKNEMEVDIPSPELQQIHVRPDKHTSPRQDASVVEISVVDIEEDGAAGMMPLRHKGRHPKSKHSAKQINDEPPAKRQKRGPTRAISVMRLKGFGVGGITVVDSTRTSMEDWINAKIAKLREKLARNNGPERAQLKSKANVALAYREALDDVLLDLQDANNSALDNPKRLRKYKSELASRRREYLTIQRERDEVALENDEVTEAFVREKKDIEARHQLNASLYDIQAAIRNGKEKARTEGREGEGPEIPLKVLLDDVARDVGSNDGLLARVRNFNGVLDRAAGILEGRA
jgi:hypothetical protein